MEKRKNMIDQYKALKAAAYLAGALAVAGCLFKVNEGKEFKKAEVTTELDVNADNITVTEVPVLDRVPAEYVGTKYVNGKAVDEYAVPNGFALETKVDEYGNVSYYGIKEEIVSISQPKIKTR